MPSVVGAGAYSRGVKEAVDAAGVVEEVPHERFTATCEYDDSGTVRGILESEGVEFEASYESSVSFDVPRGGEALTSTSVTWAATADGVTIEPSNGLLLFVEIRKLLANRLLECSEIGPEHSVTH